MGNIMKTGYFLDSAPLSLAADFVEKQVTFGDKNIGLQIWVIDAS